MTASVRPHARGRWLASTIVRPAHHRRRFTVNGLLSPTPRPPSPFIPLFWRLFVPNAAVLLGAGIVLMIQPPTDVWSRSRAGWRCC